jgi:hypothetical protein
MKKNNKRDHNATKSKENWVIPPHVRPTPLVLCIECIYQKSTNEASDVLCNKMHINNGPDKMDYKYVFIYKHYGMKINIP